MKKILLIIVIMISSFSYYGATNENGERVVDIENTSQKENVVENEIVEESQEVITGKVENTAEEEKTEIKNTISENTTQPIREKVKNENNTTKNKEVPKIQEKQNTPEKKQEKTEVKEKETVTVTEEKKEETKTNEEQKQKTNNAPKCNHTKENWYNSETEAKAVYESESKELSDKWLNHKITNEEYFKNRPYGYETFSCPYCKSGL